MPRLDPQGLRDFANCDWGAPERLARRDRARLPVEEEVRLAIALYEAARASTPGWPDEATRRADLRAHLRMRALLDRGHMSALGDADTAASGRQLHRQA